MSISQAIVFSATYIVFFAIALVFVQQDQLKTEITPIMILGLWIASFICLVCTLFIR